MESNLKYWDSFYESSSISLKSLPSQFAAFSIGEILTNHPNGTIVDGIIELGCGNGRDSNFFATYGLKLLGLDSSIEAIELCRNYNCFDHVYFVQQKAADAYFDIKDFLIGKNCVAVYARFFLHAIDEGEEHKVLSLLAELLPNGSQLFFEYRTVEDASQEKIFGNTHYRRYLNHESVLSNIKKVGFSVVYEVEGNGFAKYKNEDARVGRCIAFKNKI